MLIRYWCRIILLGSDNPLSHIYKELLDMHRSGKKNWCTTVMDVLTSLGRVDLWDAHLAGTDDTRIVQYLPQLKCDLEEQYRTKWFAEINDSVSNPILRTYKLFKSSHNAEAYLFASMSVKFRKIIAKFRVSSHQLRIETGRHERPRIPESDRKCLFCS